MGGVSSFAAGLAPERRYRLLPYYFAMRLHRCHLTRRLVEKWWSDAEAESAVQAWLDLLAALPMSHRVRLARRLDMTGEVRKEIPAGLQPVLARAAALHPPSFLVQHLQRILRELRRGVHVSFLAAWVEFHGRPGFAFYLRDVITGVVLPVERLRQLAGENGRILTAAFRFCAQQADGVAFLMRPELDALSEQEREIAIHFGRTVLLRAFVTMTPKLRESLVERYWSIFLGLGGMDDELILEALAAWDGSAGMTELIAWAEWFPRRLHRELLRMPARQVRQLGKAMRSASDDAIVDGARYAIRANADRTWAWLIASPQHFADTCVWLAGYGAARSRRLFAECASAPLFQPLPPRDRSADWLVCLDCLLRAHESLAKRLPEFATWDLHFAGIKVLKPHSVEDVAARIVGQFPLLQMWWLQERIRPALALHPQDHASLFHATLQQNRRPLTRFLRAHRDGRDPRIDHPSNQHWLARFRNRFPVEAWLHPPATSEGGWTLAVERDPLEILKIGSYVGSCLALGACNAHAAVAVLLDINKRVVFARNARGGFVARQVVAINDDGKLVCYPVYGHIKSAALHDAFERYAQAWANRLGLPLATGKDQDASERVRPLTVKEWYDDGLWERPDRA